MTATLRLLWASAFAFFLSFYLLLSALPLYAREAGVSDGALDLVIGSFALASMLVRPWAGWASDRFGRRPLLLAGAALFVVAPVAYTVTVTVPALVLVRLLHGAGMGLFPTAASALVADAAPPARRGELLGSFGAAANVAMAAGPGAGVALVERAGFVPLFAASAVAAAGALALTAPVPESLAEPKRVPLRLDAALSAAALSPSLVALCLMVTYGAQVAFLPIHAQAQGVNSGLFFLVFALVVAGVRGHAGRLSDRLGRTPVAATGLVLAAAGVAALALARGLGGLTVAAALYGVGFGSAQPALMAWCVDRAGAQDRGRAMGTYYTALELGIAGGAVGAELVAAAVGPAAVFLAAGAIAAAGATLAVARR